MSNPELDLAFNFVENTGVNIFLTGRAGTGKTTFLHNLRIRSPKRMIVVAPTGVAAINAGGVTIHSFFQLPFGYYVPDSVRKNGDERKFSKIKINIIRSIELLVIDEISMVRADMLDAVDSVLRRYRNNSLPFGGVQLLMIGDLHQLAPVIRSDEWETLKSYYDTPYFFDSNALKASQYRVVELKHIYRQKDSKFIDLLTKVRNGDLDSASLSDINNRFIKDFSPNKKDGYITLTSHNSTAKKVNDIKLKDLKNEEYTYTAVIEGNFPESQYPIDYQLVLKEGAQVMFTRNDSPEKRYVNGTIGEIISISDDSIQVKTTTCTEIINVEVAQWKNIKYSLDTATKEITEIIEGAFNQYPLKTAWAITIHKSQGLTFDKVVIDAANSFSHGQVYVALSRCRTLEGVVLSSPIRLDSIKKDIVVQGFSDNVENNPLTEQNLLDDRQKYFHSILIELFDFSQLIINVRYVKRLLEENLNNLYPKLIEKWNTHFELFVIDINNISTKFKIQIDQLMRNPDYSNDTLLAERITKGVEYFIDKCKTTLNPLISTLNIEIDNQEVEKNITRGMTYFIENYKLKISTLESCKDNFSISNYLKAKAEVLATDENKGKTSKKDYLKEAKIEVDESEIEDIVNSELFDILRNWRKGKAQEINKPQFHITHQKVLIAIAATMPTDVKGLIRIKGVGNVFIEKYGGEILEIIDNHKGEANIFSKE